MNEVSILLTDNEDGTLGVELHLGDEPGKAQAVALMFMEFLNDLQNKPQIITGE